MGGQHDRRAMRVFVSSTFRDMQAERDELVKRVFPQVRKLCEQRGVSWSEIDLRWGVTDEQKADGAVLPICLAEIERTRPYFIGLLGQRYGWVPEEIPDVLATAYPWLADDRGRSVTEMEIVHGVLDRPDGEVEAFFYLREADWVDALGEDERALYVEDDDAGRARLDDLRARVESSRHPVAHYTDPRHLGELVLADLTALVDRLHPPDEPDDEGRRLADLHRSFGRARFHPWVPRTDLERRLDDHAASDDVPLLLTGEHGVGCSALATNWAWSWAERHGADQVVVHHADADARSGDVHALVARLVLALDRTARPTDVVDRLASAAAPQLRAAIAAAAHASTGRVVIVLDGVDRLEDTDGSVDLRWLPDQLPADVRLLVTGHGPRVEAAFDRRGWTVERVPTLLPDERRSVATRVLAESSKALDRELLDLLASSDRCANARFLVTVLDELRQHGDHFTLRGEIERLTAAATLDDLLELVLERYERDFDRDRPGLTRDVFTSVWAAHTGLAESELRDLLGADGEMLPTAQWAPLHLAAERGLVSRGGLLGFAHADLRRAVEDRYLPVDEDRRRCHARLAAYFSGLPLSGRVTDELGWQLLAAGDSDGFTTALGDLDHFELAYRRGPAEVRRMWARFGHLTGQYGPAVRRAYEAVIADPSLHDRSDEEHDRSDRDHTDQRIWGVARVLDDAGQVAAALPLHRFLVESARRAPAGRGEPHGGDARLRAALVNLGAAALATGDLALARAQLDEAVERCRRAGDDAMLASALHDLAIVRRRDGDRVGASALLDEVLAIGRRRDDDDVIQAALGELVIVARELGDTERAFELVDAQEASARRLADPLAIDTALAVRATLHADRGELALAVAEMERRVSALRDEGLVRNLAEALLNLGVTRQQMGDGGAATVALVEAEQHARTLGSPELLTRVLVSRSGLAGAGGDWAVAEQLAREAELTARSAGCTEELTLALGHLGTARRELGDLDGCEAAHREELALAEASGRPAAIANARGNLGNVAVARGRHGEALGHYDAAIEGFRSAGLRPSTLPLLANRAQIRHGSGDAGAAADYVEAARIALELGSPDGARQWAEPGLQLSYGSGDTATAEQAWEVLEEVARHRGDDHALQLALGERALLVIGRAAPSAIRPTTDVELLDSAAALLAEQEAICRRTGDDAGLTACVGNQAIVARYRGDLDGSLALLDAQLAMAVQRNDAQGALFATANRGEVLGLLGRTGEAREALQSARATAHAYGLAPMVQQLDAMLSGLR